MKKILMLMVLALCYFPFMKGQDIKSITGSKSVKVNTQESYWLYFESAVKTMTKITVMASHGRINGKSNPNDLVLTIYPGQTSIMFNVFWDSITANNAFIIAHKAEGAGNQVILKDIKISKDTPPKENGNSDYVTYTTLQNGIAMSGDIITFGIKDYNRNDIEIKKWVYDKNDFDVIESKSNYIKLKPKQVIGNKNVKVTAEIEYKYYSFLDLVTLWGSRGSYSWGFPVYGMPVIKNTTNTNVICTGGNTSYQVIENLPMNVSSQTTWSAGNNMSLTSSNNIGATFKATGNGAGQVKAKITMKGTGTDNKDFTREYNIVNSDVWIGKPAVTILPAESSGWYEQNTSYVFSAKIDGAGSSGTTWKVEGNAQAMTKYGKIMTGYTGKKEGVFDITCTVTNVCGTDYKIYTGRLNPTSGPGIPGGGIGL